MTVQSLEEMKCRCLRQSSIDEIAFDQIQSMFEINTTFEDMLQYPQFRLSLLYLDKTDQQAIKVVLSMKVEQMMWKLLNQAEEYLLI